jgi:hypothetical protein
MAIIIVLADIISIFMFPDTYNFYETPDRQ